MQAGNGAVQICRNRANVANVNRINTKREAFRKIAKFFRESFTSVSFKYSLIDIAQGVIFYHTIYSKLTC